MDFRFGSIAYGLLSVGFGIDKVVPIDVIFYINIVLMFCALAQMTALIVLCRKTLCAVIVGLSTVFLFGFGIILFFVQLLLYTYKNVNAMYFVYFCFAVLCSAFVVSCVYSAMLSRKSHRSLCIASAVTDIVPPVGAVLTVILSFKVKRDTPMQKYVYNGYAYTYAALGEFCKLNAAEFVDMSGTESFERLDKKRVKRKLKALKKKTSTAEGKFEYASALAVYLGASSKAVKLMKKSAEGGYTPALFNMGYYYERGVHVQKNPKKAKQYYTRAAEAGDTDAALRLGILEIETGNVEAGMTILKNRAENENDICARFNLGVCAELGIGMQPDMQNALDIYCDCIKAGLFTAEKRVFALAAQDINSAQNGDFFRKVTDRQYDGCFAVMIKGLIEIKKRHAQDAANCFLNAVKLGDKWEGLARCLVGTLYIDCGEKMQDKCNGAEYIKSALELLPAARDMYSVVPRSVLKAMNAKSKAKPGVASAYGSTGESFQAPPLE